MLTGWKTVLVGLGLAVLPAATQYVGAINWGFLGPIGSFAASGLVMVLMRSLTTSPIFKK